MEPVTYKRHPDFKKLFCGTNGEVFSLKHNRFLRGSIQNNGYKYIAINHGKLVRMHRLILKTFIGPSDLPVDHINGSKTDNRLCNLEYVTSRENVHRAILLGLNTLKGNPKLTLVQVEEIRELIKSKKLKKYEIAKKYGIGKSTLYDITKGNSWKP